MWCQLGASTIGVMWRKRLSERVCYVHCVDAIPVRPNACMYLYLSERSVRFRPAELEIRDPSARANEVWIASFVSNSPLLGPLQMRGSERLRAVLAGVAGLPVRLSSVFVLAVRPSIPVLSLRRPVPVLPLRRFVPVLPLRLFP